MGKDGRRVRGGQRRRAEVGNTDNRLVNTEYGISHPGSKSRPRDPSVRRQTFEIGRQNNLWSNIWKGPSWTVQIIYGGKKVKRINTDCENNKAVYTAHVATSKPKSKSATESLIIYIRNDGP